MNFNATVKIPSSEVEHINRLLDIDSIQELSLDTIELLGVKTHTQKLLFSVTFENGVKMDLYLYSGMENYYTAPEFTFPDGTFLSTEDSAGFSLDSEEVFSIKNDLYIVTNDSSDAYETR